MDGGWLGVLLGVAVVGCGCAGPPGSAVRVGAGIEVLGRFDVEHSGRVGVFGGERWPAGELVPEDVDAWGQAAVGGRARRVARGQDEGAPDWAVDVALYGAGGDAGTAGLLGMGTGLGGVVVSAAEWRAVLDGAEANGELFGLHHPSVSVFDGQEGQVLIVNQRAFVSGFDLKASAAEFIADPRVEVFSSGVTVRMTPVRTEDGVARLTLEVDSREALGIETIETAFGTTAPIEFQVPIARADTWTAAPEIGDDEVALVGPLRTSRGAMIVAVRVRPFAD